MLIVVAITPRWKAPLPIAFFNKSENTRGLASMENYVGGGPVHLRTPGVYSVIAGDKENNQPLHDII
jgi:hypothetical protein